MGKFERFPSSSTNWFYLFLVIVIVFGSLLRCIHLDSRVYWGDEIFTLMRIAGYRLADITQELTNRSIVSIADLMVYQHPSPAKSLTETIQSLVTEEPQHTPIYFIAVRLWTEWFGHFGNTVLVVRSFSVFTSLLIFPCLYWLCLELFHSSYVGLLAIAMMAISPFYLVYAQEARPPALWALFILLSSNLLLRAIRIQTKLSWIIYTISVVLNLYNFLFSVFVVASHGAYIFFIKGFRLNKTQIAYLIATILGFLAFIPWLIAIIFNLNTVKNATKWSSAKVDFSVLLKVVINNLRDVFFNIGGGYSYLTFLLLVLIAFSFYVLLRTAPKSVWAFVFSLIGITVAALLVSDFFSQGQRSAASRYFITSYLGINLSIAYLFYIQLITLNSWYKKFWQVIITFLLVLGSVSCIIIAQSEVSFNQATYRNSLMVARIINKYDHPLIMTSITSITPNYPNNVIGILSLSHYLRPDSQFQFIADTNKLHLSNYAKAIFIYGSNSNFITNAVNTQYRPKLLFGDLDENNPSSEDLWYLERR
ncbi:glycosyltransferase family 39 protein [Sphaerospermopsis aphanizomenoides BCCUSP55]|uniref:glycosyltransferase family 39 protein n=1 Tax=Sphaerospermopsis aphanizomenoides TaxID=459663 RepID=UPI0019048853|nr:glycosyltransferase family 39 protein [Sphaerospermopsis aphanizomenoides]MBK1986118.1 glycosyltransferase family 39 protein [Sphaerospermopsis aphanizomenoides BCCUSP55]